MLRLLPKAPHPAELQRHTPVIAPVAHPQRPFWSVMIPTYNCAHYLRRTLESVLAQDPGPDKMQIEVVDDCSTRDDPEAVVRVLGRGRVNFYRQPSNQGATRTFNTCLNRAGGQWVHLLHGDDAVRAGFYRACEKIITAYPEVVMVFGQVQIIDENDQPINVFGPIPPENSPVVRDFAKRQARQQLAQFAGAVVKRAAYEQAGGFCTYFGHVADMDMWHRIGRIGAVGQTPDPYGLYRMHAGSDTSKLMLSGMNVRETVLLILSNLARWPEPGRTRATGWTWRQRLAADADRAAWDLDDKGFPEGRLNQILWAWRIQPTFRRTWQMVKSWVKWRLNKGRPIHAKSHTPTVQFHRQPEGTN
jgi:GT2 family glycosyltransferase